MGDTGNQAAAVAMDTAAEGLTSLNNKLGDKNGPTDADFEKKTETSSENKNQSAVLGQTVSGNSTQAKSSSHDQCSMKESARAADESEHSVHTGENNTLDPGSAQTAECSLKNTETSVGVGGNNSANSSFLDRTGNAENSNEKRETLSACDTHLGVNTELHAAREANCEHCCDCTGSQGERDSHCQRCEKHRTRPVTQSEYDCSCEHGSEHGSGKSAITGEHKNVSISPDSIAKTCQTDCSVGTDTYRTVSSSQHDCRTSQSSSPTLCEHSVTAKPGEHPDALASCGASAGEKKCDNSHVNSSSQNSDQPCEQLSEHGICGSSQTDEHRTTKTTQNDEHSDKITNTGSSDTSSTTSSSAQTVGQGVAFHVHNTKPKEDQTVSFHSKDLSEPTSPNDAAHVFEPSESNIELRTFGLKSSGYFASRSYEPVLTLYRRHNDDPFSMLNVHHSERNDLDSQGASVPAISPANPQQRGRGADDRAGRGVGDISAAHGGQGNTSARREHRERRARHSHSHTAHRERGHKEDGSHVSLTGIEVTVSKPQPSCNKMLKLQSPRIQCCLCACSVFSALIGMFMLSAGVCLMLNYNFLDVDTSGLPPNLHNDEGKKVVGIILICVGIGAMGVGGLVTALYFTACSRDPTPQSVGPQGQQKGRDAEQGGKSGQGRPSSNDGSHGHHHGHHHSNGIAQGRASPALSGSWRGSGSLTNIRNGAGGPMYHKNMMQARNNPTPPGPRSHGQKSRHAKKGRHKHVSHGRFKNPLAPHPEEAGVESQSLNESARRSASSSRRLAFPDRSGHDNRGAELEDDQLAQARDSLASASSGSSSITPSIIIRVDSSNADLEDSPPDERNREGELKSDFRQHSADAVVEYSASDSGEVDDVRDDEDEAENGRMSRSTVDSFDGSDATGEGVGDDVGKLHKQMQKLIS